MRGAVPCQLADLTTNAVPFYEDRGALRGTPGSAYPQPEPNATELPSSVPGRPKLIELQASATSPTPIRAEEPIATTPDCRPRAPAPSLTPTRAGHLAGLQVVRLRAPARHRAPRRTLHHTCWCERGTLHVKRELVQHCRSAASSRQGPLPRKPFGIFRAVWGLQICD